jgi:hypothetical protein
VDSWTIVLTFLAGSSDARQNARLIGAKNVPTLRIRKKRFEITRSLHCRCERLEEFGSGFQEAEFFGGKYGRRARRFVSDTYTKEWKPGGIVYAGM